MRQLERLLRVLGVALEARWIPSAVNRFADALSRTWDPGDVEAARGIIDSVVEQHSLDAVAFGERPLGETYVARRKYAVTQLSEDWDDGRARLLNPPADLLPLVIRKLEVDGGRGVLLAPNWPAQSWMGRLRVLSSRITVLDGMGGGLWQGRGNERASGE